jgi:catechol 2,3-dioxygenase-like lactoylglutathione lyase family enzyme
MASLPPTQGIRHVALRVPDLEPVERFYVDVLGYRVEWRPDPDNVYLTTGADNLALHRVTGVTGGPVQPLDHFGIVVPQQADVDAWAAHLTAHGVPLATEPRTHRDGARSFYVDDPAGNRLQIIFHPPISGVR